MLSLSKIAAYWNKEVQAITLAQDIGEIVPPKRGSSVPRVLGEDCTLIVTAANVLQLLHDYEVGALTSEQIAYVCDCLELSEHVVFANESIKGILEEMTDFEINGPLTLAKVKRLQTRLKEG